MDVQGFSHQSRSKLEQCHAKLPDKPIFLSECCSCNTMRDEDEGCETTHDNPHKACTQAYAALASFSLPTPHSPLPTPHSSLPTPHSSPSAPLPTSHASPLALQGEDPRLVRDQLRLRPTDGLLRPRGGACLLLVGHDDGRAAAGRGQDGAAGLAHPHPRREGQRPVSGRGQCAAGRAAAVVVWHFGSSLCTPCGQ